MKSLIFTTFVFLSASVQAQTLCHSKAEKAVTRFAESSHYDKNGFEAYACEQASNKAAVICEVSASKGDGAASDTYRVVLNTNCSYVFRVELIGEE